MKPTERAMIRLISDAEWKAGKAGVWYSDTDITSGSDDRVCRMCAHTPAVARVNLRWSEGAELAGSELICYRGACYDRLKRAWRIPLWFPRSAEYISTHPWG